MKGCQAQQASPGKQAARPEASAHVDQPQAARSNTLGCHTPKEARRKQGKFLPET